MAHLTSPDFEFADLAASSWISPHKTFDVSSTRRDHQEGRRLRLRSDRVPVRRLDQMPGAVGAGSFWKGMTSWISGQQSPDEALKSIEESWPT